MPNQSTKRKTLFSLQNYGASNGYARSASNIGISGTNPVSLIQWVLPQKLTGAFQVCAAIGNPSVPGASYILGIDNSNKYIARLGSTISAQGPIAIPGVALPLIMTSNGSRLRLYMGSALMAEASITPNITNAPLMIGSDLTSGASPFFGLMSTPIVCNAELTQSEVNDFVSKGIIPSSAFLHYSMGLDGGAGTALVDAIGTNNATITGLTWNTWSPYQERRRVMPAKSALRLDGSSGYIPFGTHASYAIGNVGWLKGRFLLDKKQIDTSTANSRFILTLGDGTLNNFITIIVQNTTNAALSADTRSGGVSSVMTSEGSNALGLLDGKEHEAILTWDVNGADLFLDGKRVASSSGDKRVAALTTGTPDLVSGRLNSGINARYATGEVSGLAYGNAKLTAQEVYDNYFFGKSLSSQVGAWECNDVGGPTVNVAGTGNAATIGGTTTWVKRAGNRRIANQNMIQNGDFETTPPFVAATNTSSRYIDGTSGGSTTNALAAWFLVLGSSVTGTANFDETVKRSNNASMKLVSSVANAASSVGVFVGQTAQSSPSVANQRRTWFPFFQILPTV